MDSNSGKIRKKNPRENSFVLSSLTFAYIIPTFVKGFTRNLSEADLTETLSEHKSKYLGDKLEKNGQKKKKMQKSTVEVRL
ncbi:hypothetical protein WA026_003564 [Henosepilachna vigintioctopunctata]|uniref:Uncharacterized protein n=1 Tax=Henosepilachna vigintioctopunctata TaxID=420089 RepID=A0AAW1TMG8_9CUCU